VAKANPIFPDDRVGNHSHGIDRLNRATRCDDHAQAAPFEATWGFWMVRADFANTSLHGVSAEALGPKLVQLAHDTGPAAIIDWLRGG
jgi:hypothetical protein